MSDLETWSRLTRPQAQLLAEACGTAGGANTYGLKHRPTAKLIELGWASLVEGRYGVLRLVPTTEGRAVEAARRAARLSP